MLKYWIGCDYGHKMYDSIYCHIQEIYSTEKIKQKNKQINIFILNK